MGLFDFVKVCLFSEVKGVVTLEGKPVAGAELVRTAEIGEKVHTDKTMTDENGRFSFPAMYTHSLNKIAPVEPHIPQMMRIRTGGNEFLVWDGSKRDYDLNGEIDRNLVLSCELTEKEKRYEIGASIYHSICQLN
jgi:hypothetical protein